MQKKVFLIGERNSVFIEEITKDSSFKEFIHIPQDDNTSINHDIPDKWRCPKCQQGRMWKKQGHMVNLWLVTAILVVTIKEA